MKKGLFGLVAGLLTLVLGVGVVLANAPTVTLDPIGPLSFATFPQVYNVTGSIFHEPNATSVSEVKLYINDVQEGASVNPNVQNQNTATFSLPWNILGPGTYNVKVTAKHGNDIGQDAEDVEVTLIEEPVVITQCPAAPSIAAHYLQDKGVKSGSKTFKNVISLVAQHMGPQTNFDGVTACSEGYASVVKTFVDGNMNVAK